MSSYIFKPSHFETAERNNMIFRDPEREILMELGGTLPILQHENGVLGFTIDQLTAYHMLHYGADRLITDTVVRKICNRQMEYTGGDTDPVARTIHKLEEVLDGALDARRLNSPLALGRIAIHENLTIPDELEDLTWHWSLPRNNSSVERPDTFLYPIDKEKTVMNYAGILPTWSEKDVERVADAHPILQDYVSSKSYYDLDFHEIKIRHGEVRRSFLVASLFDSGSGIREQLGGIAPFDPEDFADLYQHYDY